MPHRATLQAVNTPTRVERIQAATPAERDRYLDLVRLVAILAVAVGHWLMILMAVHRTGGVSQLPAVQLGTWLWQVMPLFFLVGGFSHARALRHRPPAEEFLRHRAARLLPPVLGFLVVWALLAAALAAAGLAEGPLDRALDVVTTPLWFLAVYLLMVLLAPLTHRLHVRFGLRVPLVLGVVAVLVDLARFVGGVPELGMLNIAAVWLAVHQIGYFRADGRLPCSARSGGVIAAAALGATLLLTVVTGWYPVLMVGIPDAPTANLAPPTVALLCHAMFLTGLLIMLRRPVTAWLARPRPWFVTVVGNGVIMTIFCWHVPAAFLTEGLRLITGWRVPPPGTGEWWSITPLWVLVCAVCCALLVLAFRGFERLRVEPSPTGTPVTVLALVAVAAGCYFVAQTGLDGLLSARAEPGEPIDGLPMSPGAALGVLFSGVAALYLAPSRHRAPAPPTPAGR